MTTVRRSCVRLALVPAVIGLATLAHAQGLFGAVSEAFVDTVNAAVGIEPDANVRRLQVDAVAVAVRGSDEDWERFLASTLTAAEGVAGETSTRRVLEQTRAAAASLGRADPRSSVWDPPTFAALQVSGLGTVPARVVESAFDSPPAMRDWRVESIAYGAIDTPGVDRMIALLSARRADAPADVPGSPYADWDRSHFLLVFPVDSLETVIAAASVPDACSAYGTSVLSRLPNGLGPLTLVDLDGSGRQEMLFTGVCRIGYLPNGFYEPGAAQYDLVVEIARFELHDGSVRFLTHANPVLGDPEIWVAQRDAIARESLRTVGRWADAPHAFNPGVLFHSIVRVEPGERNDTLVVERYRFDAQAPSPLLRAMLRGEPDVAVTGGDHAWTKRFWIEPSGEPVVEVVAGVGRALVEGVTPLFIEAISERQAIQVSGSGFSAATEVVVWADERSFVVPPERRDIISDRRMTLTVGLFPAHHDWRIAVRNPDDGRWSDYRLRVIPQRSP